MADSPKEQWGPARFRVSPTPDKSSNITIKDRFRWALESLIAAGPKGCGPFKGTHARYALQAKVERLPDVADAA